MADRLCFLVVDREVPNGISTRKLVLETAKFNVITAYSPQEARDMLQRFPNVDGMVVSDGTDDEVSGLLRQVRGTHPDTKLVLTGRAAADDVPCDAHLESYAPESLLNVLRNLFPEASDQTERREEQLENEAG